jgi:4,5-dihydroxyphthalate decarboxylase
MAEPTMRFRYHEPDIDTNRPIVEGQVKIEGFQLEVLPNDAPEYDVWEAGSSSLPPSLVDGNPGVSIPVWPNRKFRQSYIFVNSAAGIEQPGDLEGKRVALAAWSNPGGVWAKGALQNTYEVDLSKINWVVPEADPTPMPEWVRVERVRARRDFDPMLVAGELDAVIEPNRLPAIVKRDPRVRRLFPDYKVEEQKYWRETGIFPISHVVTLRREFVERHPNAPVALLKAYRQARDLAFDRVLGSDPEYLIMTWAAAGIEEQRALMGDNYWPYNVVDNRPALQAITQFAHQQGLTPYQVDYEQFFDPAAAALPGA